MNKERGESIGIKQILQWGVKDIQKRVDEHQMEGNVVACFFQLFVCCDSHSRTHGVQILNTMDIGSVVQAITALYDCSVSVILFYEK